MALPLDMAKQKAPSLKFVPIIIVMIEISWRYLGEESISITLEIGQMVSPSTNGRLPEFCWCHNRSEALNDDDPFVSNVEL